MNPGNMEQLRQWWKNPKEMSHWRAKDHSWNRTLKLWRQWKEKEVMLITLRKGSFVLKKGHLLHNEKNEKGVRLEDPRWRFEKLTKEHKENMEKGKMQYILH